MGERSSFNSQNYQITLENSSVNAVIPVNEAVEEPEVKNPFTDVAESDFFYNAVLWGTSNGIVYGVSDTTFEPNTVCTRAQVVSFLYRAAGKPDVSDVKNPFTDVAADAYYADAVKWGVSKGIVAGTSDTTYDPDASCTRGQVAAFLYRAAGKPDVSALKNPFTDVAEKAYYADAVKWAASEGIVFGKTTTTYAPDDACTRAEVVAMLYRQAVKAA